MRFLPIALSLFCAKLFGSDDEFIINLQNPKYQNGVVTTEQGGVISAQDLHIQADHIVYSHHAIDGKKTERVQAEGNLMMLYQGHILVGDKLDFDLSNRTGFLLKGRMGIGSWFVGGERIELDGRKSAIVYGGFATTSVSRSNPWAIRTDRATLSEGYILDARNVYFTAGRFPILWLPRYKSNLEKYFKEPALRYRFLWDKGLGPKASLRWRFFSSDTFASYLRLDYRQKVSFAPLSTCIKGPGAALEATYTSLNKRTTFQTRNYGAYDLIFAGENGCTRYRLQGLLTSKSKDEYTRFRLQWDRLSDNRMVSDFKDPDFEVNTQKATYLEYATYQDYGFFNFTVRPRINPFDSLAQEFPVGTMGIRPFQIGKTGVISENYVNSGYLDYTFANQLDKELKDRHSIRLETQNSLYRPFSLWGFTATPKAGLVSIFYTRSPQHQAAAQLLYTYGGDLNFRASKQYESVQHAIEPYARYLGYTRPKTPVDDYFVFDIHDGYDRLDQVRFGLRQLFFTKENPIFLPGVTVDLYSYAFWGANSFVQRIPKVFASVGINKQSWSIWGEGGWNLQENVLDYGNIRFLWTISSSLALGTEFRHRSKFWWRKANYENFVVDFARFQNNLLISPLSDGRNTLLVKAHFRFSPRWNLNVQTHHGWGRKDEPRYNGAKVDLYTMLTGSWQMKLSYEYAPNEVFRFSYSLKLLK